MIPLSNLTKQVFLKCCGQFKSEISNGYSASMDG
jgi:hypothetical protein